MSGASSSPSQRAWAIHFGVLVALGVTILVVFWDFWSGAAKGLMLALAVSLVVSWFCLQAAVTTVLMLFVGRTWRAPLIMHGLGLGLVFAVSVVFLYAVRDERRADEAELAAIEAERPSPSPTSRACMRLERVRALPGTSLRAELTLVNTCSSVAAIHKITLTGFDPAGDETCYLMSRERIEGIEPGAATVVSLASWRAAADPQALATWRWRAELWVEAPETEWQRFATPGAPGCEDCPAPGSIEVAPLASP